MNLPYCLLVSAGLLAPPALAETAGLRGGVQAEVDAENDHAAIRELQAFEFSEPEDPGFPDIRPGFPLELPPGAIITEQNNEVSQLLESSSSEGYEKTELVRKVAPATDDDAYYYSAFENYKEAGGEVASEENMQIYDYERKGPGAFSLQDQRFKNLRVEGSGGSEDTVSEFRVKGEGRLGVNGFYRNYKFAAAGTAEDQKAVFQDIDENGPNYQYYYRFQGQDDFVAEEHNYQEYDIEFSLSLP